MKRPCGCDSCVIGEPWVRQRDCRDCWLYWNDPRYRRIWTSPADPPNPKLLVPLEGPGTELKAMLQQLGFENFRGCGCDLMVAVMNAWGVEGCRANFGAIVDQLRLQQQKIKMLDQLLAASRAISAGIILDPRDVAGSLVRKAIRRAERKMQKP